jgi:nitroimidazol reductase NimA-like FMN-containing flavoprotein (pyridoxamine 5'-phosphate oxidase superfamily)
MDHPPERVDAGRMTITEGPTAPPTTPSAAPAVARPPVAVDDAAQVARTLRVIRTRSFAVLSTVSDAGFPHAAGVAYAAVGSTLYVNTERSSRKARNVAADDRVAMVIPVRRLPVGPPFTVQFQGRATVVAMDDPEIAALVAAGSLDGITRHGELEEPDGCSLRIVANGPVHTYGIGVSALAVARDPLHVGTRSIDLGVPA